ncbi:MAG: tryptophan synthase subunit alpha [Candidatus Aramenus sulfurataquae]|jgi:tryptophan synthase alpha chain|uniref:Tryptophan synthase alpha chain n=2 Tax=Candidatus Aramenus sulfurataquae TaxID=1326980 RepID=W7KUT8_9CREN|nr:MAG: tryptophan synthase subunit alpha [Candidatus Aramenus sulfurataquae]MCL7344037.1 tryptophan synthase subunit alpha [Candidatus Aramenus sulfurataquae]
MRKMLVSYMTLGYPNVEGYLEFIDGAISQGSDVLEVGMKPKFAKYDGPVIRKSYKAVNLSEGDTWELLKETRKRSNVPTIVLTYLEDWLGKLDEFLSRLREVGVDGVLFPDLIIDFTDEYDKYVKVIRDHGLKAVIFTSPSVPDAMIHDLSKNSDLFLYYGVRPTTGVPIPVSVDSLITRVRTLVENKLVVGFGLSDVEDMKKALRAGADGIAIGTAYIEEVEKRGVKSAISLVKYFRGVLDEF